MKIGILYICTGKYSVFWKDFYETAEENFLPATEKHYYVFTDDDQLIYKDRGNVHTWHQEKQEWPYPTLLRFHMFDRAKAELLMMDYIFFFNANMKFVTSISPEDILPDNKTDDGLVVVLHSGYYRAPKNKLPYERNQKRSLAYLENGEHYFQGCLNGGNREAYLKMIEHLKTNIQKDLDQDIIAVWHDESHLNKYMSDKHPRILPPAFSYPEGQDLNMPARILMLDKSKLGGHQFLRGQQNGIIKKIWNLFKK
jgi:hypothetical protein